MIFKCIGNYRLIQNVHTKAKTRIAKAISNKVTDQWVHGPQNTFNAISPDLNYATRVATIELLVGAFCKMTTEQLFSINNELIRVSEKIPYITLDADFIQLYTLLCSALKSRICVKVIDVNMTKCFCNVKCMGPIHDSKLREQINHSLRIYSDVLICSLCRLCPSIDNNANNKPRQTMSVHAPGIDACSLDGNTRFKYIRLYHSEICMPRDGELYYKYRHAFYSNNSVSIINAISGNTQSGIGSKLYGMCYYGLRTCFNLIIIEVPSSRAKDLHNRFLDTKHFYRCKTCATVQSTPTERNMGYSREHANETCLSKYFTGLNMTALHMCDNCKLAAHCSHNESLLIGKLDSATDTLRTLRRLKMLSQLKQEIQNITIVGTPTT